jgi:hypothetical protein
MARTLSSTAIASQNAQETGEVWLVLLTISHADLATPIRVVNNNEDIVSRGLTFQAFPFEIVLPNEDPDQPPKAYLRIDNVDRSVIAAVRGISSTPSVTIEVILASAPNNVEIGYSGFSLRNVTFDVAQIEAELLFESIFGEPITASMTPSRFPGMF